MTEFKWQNATAGEISIDGTRLETLCLGPSPQQAPTIVMLHEGLGCVALWRDFPQKLAAATGMGVFVWSRAGYGKSDPCPLPRPLDYQTREAMEVVPKLLDTIGFRGGILLGHSDGATMSAIYAGMGNDKRVRGVVVIAPHFFAEPMGLASIAKAKASYETTDLRAKLAKYHDHVDCAFNGWSGAWLDPAFRNWNVADCIDYLRMPILAIQGRDDEYGTLAQIAELKSRTYCPLDTLILDQCGHAPHLEKPEETLAAISDFTTRLQRIEASEVPLS